MLWTSGPKSSGACRPDQAAHMRFMWWLAAGMESAAVCAATCCWWDFCQIVESRMNSAKELCLQQSSTKQNKGPFTSSSVCSRCVSEQEGAPKLKVHAAGYPSPIQLHRQKATQFFNCAVQKQRRDQGAAAARQQLEEKIQASEKTRRPASAMATGAGFLSGMKKNGQFLRNGVQHSLQCFCV